MLGTLLLKFEGLLSCSGFLNNFISDCFGIIIVAYRFLSTQKASVDACVHSTCTTTPRHRTLLSHRSSTPPLTA